MENEDPNEHVASKKPRVAVRDTGVADWRGEETLAWKVTFHQASLLRSFVDVLGSILSRLQIRVCKDDDFEGVRIEAIDAKRVCLVAGQLACAVKLAEGVPPEKMCFCVDTGTLSTCLRSVSQHFSIDMEQHTDTDVVVVRSYEVICQNYVCTFKLPTLAEDDETVKLQKLDHRYVVEFETTTLRSIVKNCMALKGDNLIFTVHEQRHASEAGVLARLIITAEGNAEQEHVFHSVAREDAGTLVLRAAVSSSGSGSPDVPGRSLFAPEPAYRGTFSVTYLNQFLKNMDRNSITLRLAEKHPLVVTYPLGIEKSSVCFVLAFKTTDDDD